MYLKYFVYVSSVNNLSDARYCSGMFVDYIGFNFDENSKNHITIEKFSEIKNWININVNNVKIKLNINNRMTEPFFTGVKRIDPKMSLKVFIDEFKDKDIAFKKEDYLLCGSLIQPYNIKEKDHININYENLGKFEIKII